MKVTDAIEQSHMHGKRPWRTAEMLCPHAQTVIHFLTDIGLKVYTQPGAEGFVLHVSIIEGALNVDPRASASNLLHEAGHLAVCPTRYRHYLSGDLELGFEKAFCEVDEMNLDPQDALIRNLLQAGETEATAWAWAAGLASGIPEELIIQDKDYDGAGAEIRLMLSMKAYCGINGLSNAGFCHTRAWPGNTGSEFPSLNFWLQA